MRQPSTPDRDELKRIIEAILFAHEGSVTPDLLVDVIQGVEVGDVRSIMDELQHDYAEHGHSFEIVRVAGGYQICTREQWATWVSRFQRGKRRVRLSRAAVETLGIIAFRQPVTRAEIEDIRGVDTGGVVHTLLERNLVAVKGRAKTVGRPLLYVTTSDFLEYFGLDTLDDLPQLEEIEELIKDSTDIMEEIEAEAGPVPEDEGEAAAEGEATEGEATEGEVTSEGGATEGEATQSEPTEAEVTAGETPAEPGDPETAAEGGGDPDAVTVVTGDTPTQAVDDGDADTEQVDADDEPAIADSLLVPPLPPEVEAELPGEDLEPELVPLPAAADAEPEITLVDEVDDEADATRDPTADPH